ncbi:MAG: CPBP family intramembrane glutamic endopeptidase [Cyclobacteriaceae bacterium]
MKADIQEYQDSSRRSLIASLFLLTGFIMLGLVAGNFVGIALSLPFYEGDWQGMLAALADPTENPGSRRALLIIQACTSLFGFILAPLLYRSFIEGKSPQPFFSDQHLDIGLLLLVMFIVMIFMVGNSVIIEWNMNIDFGQLFPQFEEWASAKEEQLRKMTEYLTRFTNIGGLLVGLIVIAVIPAIGEELVFRGLGQRILTGLSGSHHAGIWIAAFLFSFIHLQFYGFFPRLLLGALFGYIYYWSGNLWYPIFAHFVNNAFTLVMLYMYQQEATDMNIEETDVVPLGTALLAIAATIGLLYFFRKKMFEIRAE